MTFSELLEKVRGLKDKIDTTGTDFLAVQVNIKGDNGGVFYIEVKNGKVNVEPYEYIDRSCALTMTNDNFNKLIDGKLDPVASFTVGKLKVDGDLGKALEFSKIIKR